MTNTERALYLALNLVGVGLGIALALLIRGAVV